MNLRMKVAVAAAVVVVVASTLHAATVAAKITWANETYIPVHLVSEGIEITEVRFAVEGGVNWNPLRSGVGPQCLVEIKNTADHPMHLSVAVALFDAAGDLIGATESGHTGQLSAAETGEIKMTFREVKRRFFDAKTAQIALETWK